MKTIDLAEQAVTVDQLLNWAKQDAIRILSANGYSYILEEADVEFEQEAELLGQSDRLIAFLERRAQEPGGMTLDEFEELLDEETEEHS